MGPKKGKGGKSKKKGKGGADDASPEELNFILQAEIESLSLKLQRQMKIADMAKSEEMETRSRDHQQAKDVTSER